MKKMYQSKERESHEDEGIVMFINHNAKIFKRRMYQ